MIHRLEIENFYSIRDRQVSDLGVDGTVPDDRHDLAPLWTKAGRRGPKVVALFGANASGKSNVLKALSFLIWFVKDSFIAPRDQRLPFDRFNDADMLRRSTRLRLGLSGLEDLAQSGDPQAPRCRYEYELELGGGVQPVVTYEALSHWPAPAGRRIRLFERDAGGTVSSSKSFDLKGFKPVLQKILRPRSSVISTLAQIEHPYARAIWNTAANATSNLLIYRQEPTEDQMIRLYAGDLVLLENLNREIGKIDLGIRAMQLRQGPNGPLAFFEHVGMPEPMPLLYESEGTRHFIKLFPWLVNALRSGGLAVVDELDSAIHPRVLPEIVRCFQDPRRNPLLAQLWRTCHNATLLDDLSREEVVFCEKDGSGRTEIYGLGDIEAVGPRDDFYRQYIGGRYGAVPNIG